MSPALLGMLWPLAAVAVAAPVDNVLAAAAARESSGDPVGALALVEPWYSDDTQSYALALRVGWLAALVGRDELAASAYRRAAELSSGGFEPRLGLAWTLIRQGETHEAGELHAALEAERPDDPRVEELGLALQPGRRPGSLWVGVGGLALAPHHAVDYGAGVGAGGRVELGGFVAGLSGAARRYRLRDSAPRGSGAPVTRQDRNVKGTPGTGAGTGDGSGNSAMHGWLAGATSAEPPTGGAWASDVAEPGTEVEGWGRLGHGGDRAGIEAVGAALLHTETTPGAVAGVLGRVSGAQDWRLQLSWTRPRGTVLDVYRAAPSVWVPAGRFAVEPGAALQGVAGHWLPTGWLTLWWTPRRGAAWLGGQYGASLYESDVALGYSTAYPDLLRASAWLGGRVGALDDHWVSLRAVVQWVDPDGSGPAGTGVVGLLDLVVHTAIGGPR